jgi:hypothetical protein
LVARPLLTQHDRTAIIESYNVERVLPNIDTNYGDRILCCCSGHCVLLVWAPLASLSLAGQEHGRTIPLADIQPNGAAFTLRRQRVFGPIKPSRAILVADVAG